MATIEQEKETLASVLGDLDKLLATDERKLLRQDLGPLGFDAGAPYFERSLALFRDLSDVSLEGMPFEQLKQLAGTIGNALTHVTTILEFDPQQHENPFPQRDALLNQFRDQWNSHYSVVTPVVAYRSRKQMDLGALERQARGTVATLDKERKSFEETKTQLLADMKAALDEVQSAAAQAGVSQQAAHFNEEADQHRSSTRIWLAAAIAFGVATILYVWLGVGPAFADLAADAPLSRVIGHTISRLAIISVLTFGLVWSARNYSRNRHNYVVNRHRRNALATFNTFVEASSDRHVKDSVLLQATRAIFAPQSTGYGESASESTPSNQVVEVLTRLSDTTSGQS